MSRVGQLQAAKIRIGRKVRKVKDFSSQGGLDAQELPGEHRLKQRCEVACSATREYSKSKNPSLLFACRLGFVSLYSTGIVLAKVLHPWFVLILQQLVNCHEFIALRT